MFEKKVKVEGYLTERKLSKALEEITGDRWIGKQVQIPGSRMKWDIAFSKKASSILVEYDGDEHYRNSIKIKKDEAKDQIAMRSGYKVVRFPYWVQLDVETLSYFFGLSASIYQDFPHGFITTKLFPASFCELGIERFTREMAQLPCQVREAVLQSLRDRAKEHGEYVLPSRLRYLING